MPGRLRRHSITFAGVSSSEGGTIGRDAHLRTVARRERVSSVARRMSGDGMRRARTFLASFLVLFLEIALIRWMPAYIRLLSYFSNFILLASFLGIGLGCLLVGAALQLEDVGSFIRVASIGAFVLLTTPVSAHVIARASYLADVPLWEGTVLDERRRDADRVAQNAENAKRG